MQKVKAQRVEILVVIVMVLQCLNYVSNLIGPPVRWGIDFTTKVSVLEKKVIDKCKSDSTYFAANAAEHEAIKYDISLIKNAVVSVKTKGERRVF
jgi:hypothetical protein